MGVTMLQLKTHPEIEKIYEEIDEQEGVITPEQERRLEELLVEQLGLEDLAREITNRRAAVDQLRAWREEARVRIARWDEMIGRQRELLRKHMLDQGLRKFKSDDGFLSVSIRKNSVGRLEILDAALDREKEVRGYTEDQVRESTIGLAYFEPRTVYVLQKDMLKEHAKEGHDVGAVEVSHEPSVQIRTAK